MKKKTTDRILGISAILISLLTLIIFIYQTNIIHRQSRLSVMPRLSFHSNIKYTDSLVTFTFSVQNKGIGPAYVERSALLFEDQEYDIQIQTFLEDQYPSLFSLGHFNTFTTIDRGETLTPNEIITLYTYVFKRENEEKIAEVLDLEENVEFPISVIIDYCSIYEECWRIESEKSGHPEKL